MGTAILTSTNAAWPWTTTAGQTVITAEALGAGGGGGGVSGNPAAGGGGKGGSYAKVVITKGAESTLNITVGLAGTAGAATGATGGSGGFCRIVQGASTVLEAPGGVGGFADTTNNLNGAGATTVNGTATGTTTFAGGNGGTGNSVTPISGAGGGAAGPGSVGGAASGATAGAKGTGTWNDGSTTRHVLGAAGLTSSGVGTTGGDYGGGGSGGLTTAATNRAGGAGGAGIVVLTWVDLPVLTGQTVGTITSSSGIPAVATTVANGTAYVVIVPNGDTPSVTQIKAGQQSSGAAAIASSNQAVSGTGVQTFATASGLTSNTAYDAWFVHTETGGSNSVAVKADFSTLASFNTYRQALIDGIDSAQSEAAGWDVKKAGISVTAVVRTSSTVVTVTLPALATYDITATETLTVTIPAGILTGNSAIVATPTLTITSGGGAPVVSPRPPTIAQVAMTRSFSW